MFSFLPEDLYSHSHRTAGSEGRGRNVFVKRAHSHPGEDRSGVRSRAENLRRQPKPLIGALNQNPSLEGLFGNLRSSQSLLRESDEFTGGLDPVYNELAKVVSRRLEGDPLPFSWQALFRVWLWASS